MFCAALLAFMCFVSYAATLPQNTQSAPDPDVFFENLIHNFKPYGDLGSRIKYIHDKRCPVVHIATLSYYTNYVCYDDMHCKVGYKCCNHVKFEHKICLEAVAQDEDREIIKNCPPLTYECSASTKSKYAEIKCESDMNCLFNETCCLDFCVSHKVCKPKVHVIALRAKQEGGDNWFYFISPYLNANLECPVRKECLKGWMTKEKFKCSVNENCPYGFVCCWYGCYTHKVCLQNLNLLGGREMLQGIYFSVAIDENMILSGVEIQNKRKRR